METIIAEGRARRRIAVDILHVLSLYRWRILAALLCLITAKVATVAVPLVLKRIIDAFSNPAELARLPLYLLGGYALLRFLSTLFNELRDLLFARVTLRTVAIYAEKIFAHLHSLSAAFHARRQIGGLLPDIDRGTNGIAFLLGVGLFTIVPTLIEIALVLAILLNRYSAWYGHHHADVSGLRRLHARLYRPPRAVPAARQQARLRRQEPACRQPDQL